MLLHSFNVTSRALVWLFCSSTCKRLMQWCLGLSSLNTLGSLPLLRHSVVAGSSVDPLLDTLNRCVECSCGQGWEWEAAASEIVHLTENLKIYTTASTWASFSVMALSVFRCLCFLAFWRFWNDLRGLTVGEHSRCILTLRSGHWITRNALWPPSVVSVFYICCHWHLPTLKTIESRHGKVFPASPQEAQTTVVHNPADGTKVRPLSCQPPLPPVTLVCTECWLSKSGLFWTDNPEVLVLQSLTTVICLGLFIKVDHCQVKIVKNITWFSLFRFMSM